MGPSEACTKTEISELDVPLLVDQNVVRLDVSAKRNFGLISSSQYFEETSLTCG
jgi:hypothetical protein